MDKKINQLVKYLAVGLISSVITLAVVVGVNYEELYLKHLIKTQFYEDVDMNMLESASKKAMVEELGDKYTYYIDEEYGFENFTGQATGNYSGIGISIALEGDGSIKISYVMPDTPAEKEGLLAGDIISAVNGKSVKGLDTNGVASLVKGKTGEIVKITVLRNGEEKSFDVIRSFISANSVTSEKMGDIGYAHISSFDDDVHTELKNHIDKMGEMKGLVIDLRDNPGGLLNSVISTLEMFVDEGNLITIKYKNGEKEDTISATGKQIYKMPLVVLTNGNSASASELFTAAIKDNERGISVGTTTYGKGSVQRSFPLGNDTGINLTIARFFSPNGNEINEVGVAPDVEIHNNDVYKNKSILSVPREDDLQLQEALKQFK